MAVDQDSHTDTVMDIYMDHIPAVIVEGGFSQYREIRFIFNQHRNMKAFFKLTAQIWFGKRIIGGEEDLVFLNNTVDTHGYSQNFSLFLFILGQGFPDDGR